MWKKLQSLIPFFLTIYITKRLNITKKLKRICWLKLNYYNLIDLNKIDRLVNWIMRNTIYLLTSEGHVVWLEAKVGLWCRYPIGNSLRCEEVNPTCIQYAYECVRKCETASIGNVHMCMCYALRYVLDLCIIFI